MTRREFTGRFSARIVWIGLILESVYFFYLSSRLAAAARAAPNWRPDAHEPATVFYTAMAGVIILMLGVSYVMRLFKTRAWLHFFAPVFFIYGLLALGSAAGLATFIYGDVETLPTALNALSGFGFLLLGIFVIIARLFIPPVIAGEQGITATPPADRPEP